MNLPVSLVCVLFCLAFAAPGRGEGTGDSPEQQVRTFYAWYLHQLAAGIEPMQKKRAEMSKYVSASLLKRIERLSKREGGMDADPFLCAQDWDKDWEKNVSTLGLRARDGSAEGNVVLQGKEMGRYELTVQLVLEEGRWKLSKVEHH